jgi:hypothetical protein
MIRRSKKLKRCKVCGKVLSHFNKSELCYFHVTMEIRKHYVDGIHAHLKNIDDKKPLNTSVIEINV